MVGRLAFVRTNEYKVWKVSEVRYQVFAGKNRADRNFG